MSEVPSFTAASVEIYKELLLTELVVAVFGGLTAEILHGQPVCCRGKRRGLDSVRARVKLAKGVDRNEGQFLFRSWTSGIAVFSPFG